MNVLMNIIVLIFEVLYYSMFMYYAKKEGNFWKYILLFSLINIFLMFFGSLNLYAYIIFMIMSLIGLKFICKPKFYDFFILFLMLLIKLIIELLFAFSLNIIIENIEYCKIALGIIKILLVLIFKKPIYHLYIKLYKLWYKNNFYIRYIFSILMFLYIIFACLFLIIFG